MPRVSTILYQVASTEASPSPYENGINAIHRGIGRSDDLSHRQPITAVSSLASLVPVSSNTLNPTRLHRASRGKREADTQSVAQRPAVRIPWSAWFRCVDMASATLTEPIQKAA